MMIDMKSVMLLLFINVSLHFIVSQIGYSIQFNSIQRFLVTQIFCSDYNKSSSHSVKIADLFGSVVWWYLLWPPTQEARVRFPDPPTL